MSWITAARNYFDRQTNAIVDFTYSKIDPETQLYREKRVQAFEMMKVATLVSISAAAIFAVAFASIESFLVLGILSFFAYEAHTVLSNLVDITLNARIAFDTRVSKEELIGAISKDTFITKSLLRIMNPPYEELLELTSWKPRH